MTRKRKKNQTAVALGKFGKKAKRLVGNKRLAEFSRSGGRGRALALTPEQRRDIARHAAQARWAAKKTA
jgi:hypothetical protein